MTVDQIREYCLSFPGAKENLQWGDALCFKVDAKLFAILGLDEVRFTFKCAPEVFAELIERESIRPAPHLGRYKWVMLDRLDALRGAELEDLVRQSYEMVLANAPKRKLRKKNPDKRTSGKSAVLKKRKRR